MIKKTKSACPEGCPIPSKSLVHLQFAPRNPYTKAAQNFTSRLNVQYKIQRRQLPKCPEKVNMDFYFVGITF
jgi:hypothetical protein